MDIKIQHKALSHIQLIKNPYRLDVLNETSIQSFKKHSQNKKSHRKKENHTVKESQCCILILFILNVKIEFHRH